MTDVISQLKQHFNIAALVAAHTNGLSRPVRTAWGQYLNGWCPFCQNGQQAGKPRKFWVNIDHGICNCYNPDCKSFKPMDVINFYARIWGISNREAIQELNAQMRREISIMRQQ